MKVRGESRMLKPIRAKKASAAAERFAVIASSYNARYVAGSAGLIFKLGETFALRAEVGSFGLKGGISFIATTPLPLDVTILLLPQDEGALRLRCQIMRCAKVMDGFYDIGGRFLQLE